VTEAPSVSVVIPAYNRVGTIGLAVESVLRQTWRDFELIVVDDGSTDGTRDAVRAIDDPRLRLVETPHNMGASTARNLGIDAARGEWVAFQDSDDEWLPLKLEKQMARLLAPGAGYVAAYCGMIVLGRMGIAYGTGPGTAQHRVTTRYIPAQDEAEIEGDLVLPLLRRSLISTQTLVARRDLLIEIGGFDPELRSLIDWDCVLRLAPRGPIACVDEPLVLQRFSPNSITRDRTRTIVSQIRIAQKHAALFDRYPQVHARHHYVIAGAQQQGGDLAAARASLARARALRPGAWRYWAMSLLVAALPLLPRRRRPTQDPTGAS